MKAESKKSVNSEENQSTGHKLDKSRRSFAKAGMVAPVVMTLTSKSALGSIYHCTVSGNASGNQSSPHDNTTPCGVGISPGGWWQNACKTGNQNGCLNEWLAAGFTPWSIRVQGSGRSAVNQIYYPNTWIAATSTTQCTANGGCANWATVFSTIKSSPLGVPCNADIFSTIFGAGPNDTLWNVLNTSNGTLEWHAIADYLNAWLYKKTGNSTLQPVYSAVTPDDIVNLYKLAKGIISSFTTSSGVLINSTFNSGNGGVLGYLVSIHSSTP